LGEIVDELRDLEQKLRTLPALPEAGAPATPAPVPLAPAPAVAAPATAPTAPAPAPVAVPAPAAPPVAEAPAAPAPASPLPAPAEEIPAEAGVPVPAVLSIEEAGSVPSGGLTLDDLRRDWEGVVSDVQNDSLGLASAAKDAGLMALEGGTLTLKAINGFQRKVLEEPSEHVRLEAALSKRFGQNLKIRVVYAPPAPRANKGAGKPSDEDVQKLLKERPEVRRVQELFGAEIVEIRED
jgi:hypothetical protein